MLIPSARKNKIISSALFFLLLGLPCLLFCEELKGLSPLQIQARDYRNQGLELQRIGDLRGAMSFYQKALELDPSYAVVYNDLGVLYEANDMLDQAETLYLRSINVDPYFISAYSNLASLYEKKRDLDKAAFYWRKRMEMGASDDPWTQKAKQRLKDISLITSESIGGGYNEGELMALASEVETKRVIQKACNKEQAKAYFTQAKSYYWQGKEVEALKKAIDAEILDPANKEIKAFVERVQARLLSR